MFYAYCILSYHFHVSGKSTQNKRKKKNIDIDKEEDEDLMGIKADETINKGISTGNKKKKANKDINEKENEDLMVFEAGKSTGKRKTPSKEIDEVESEDFTDIETSDTIYKEKSKGNKRKKTTKQIDEEEDEDLKNIESGDGFHRKETADSDSSQEEDNTYSEFARTRKLKISTSLDSKTSISSKQKRSGVITPMSPCSVEFHIHEEPETSGTNLPSGSENLCLSALRSLEKKVDALTNGFEELREIVLSKKEIS